MPKRYTIRHNGAMKCSCEWCGVEWTREGSGRRPRFCGTRCRVAAHRVKRHPFPAEMTDTARWVRADGKRPITTTGAAASSTDPSTWSHIGAVLNGPGDGYGVMLGGGLGCYDLDHHTDAEAAAFIETVPERVLFVERSVSGEGWHVFIEAPEGKGYKRGRVERYTRARFIRTTGVERGRREPS